MADVSEIADAVLAHTFIINNERQLQDSLETLFMQAFSDVRREEPLIDMQGRGLGRVDFMVGPVAVEVKVDGTNYMVRRQLERYQRSPLVRELLLVTTRVRHLTGSPSALPPRAEGVIAGGAL